jgi:hypothetical protein
MAVLGAIPVLTGIVTMFGLSDPIYASAGLPANALLDSNLRFFGGVWLGLVWRSIGSLSMLFLAWPPVPFVAFTVLEIVGAPMFIVWHAHVAK